MEPCLSRVASALWWIKENEQLSIRGMAQRAGLHDSGLWYIMHRQRTPATLSLYKLAKEWPILLMAFMGDGTLTLSRPTGQTVRWTTHHAQRYTYDQQQLELQEEAQR